MRASGRIGLLFLFVLPSLATAASPFTSFFPKRVAADPNTAYQLTETNGPWMVFVASFAGQGAEAEARQLVFELRKGYNLPAVMHRQNYDLSQPVVGLGVDKYGNPQKMRHRQDVNFTEYAVLVGDFPTLDDRNLQKTLKKIKYMQPSSIKLTKESKSTLRFAGLRAWQKQLNSNQAKRNKGPLGQAFATRNPLLPVEYFAPKGIDKLVASMNADVQHSLLKCPGKYTVRVASFRGNVVIDQKQVKDIQATNKMESRLAEAAEKAHILTTALRARKMPAYEFHDRHESIVTVGSFDSVGSPRTDGRVEINPAVLRIMQAYGPEQRPVKGQSMVGLMPRAIQTAKHGAIPFDIQPMPIEVPQRSIAADYTARNSSSGGGVRFGGSVR